MKHIDYRKETEIVSYQGKDIGYSGKNIDCPYFQELIQDIKKGLIRKVVVYKLDRISRSIPDFANMMELFQEYNVEFVSSTAKFDTSTPMGRAMLNICIVFVQLERETIQKRVAYAYHTKKLMANPDEAKHIRLMFEMYVQPETSYGDIVRYFSEHGIKDFSFPSCTGEYPVQSYLCSGRP